MAKVINFLLIFPSIFCFGSNENLLEIDSRFDASSCVVRWVLRNNSSSAMEWPEGIMPWADGIGAPKVEIYADKHAVPQRRWSIRRYLETVKIQRNGKVVKRISASEFLENWDAPKRDLTVRWRYSIEAKAGSKEIYSGEFLIPSRCVI